MTTSHFRRLGAAALLLALLPLAACDTGEDGTGAETTVEVMTRNLYLGGDLFVTLDENCGTDDPVPTPVCIAMLYQTVVLSDIPARLDAVAAEIEANAPDLVGLQEVSLYRTQSPSDFDPDDPQQNASTVTYDFLDILMDALEARGLDYEVVATNTNADVEFPSTTDGTTFIDIRLTDHDVILARAGLDISNVREQNFAVNATIPIGGVEVEFTRGFSAVDVTKDGVSFTFANAHLEVGGAAAEAQRLQATFLANPGGLGSAEPLILLGDFNANPETDPAGQEDAYEILVARFEDAWAELRSGDDGFTCCQDAYLRNDASALDTRIDLILYRGDVRPVEIGRVGEAPEDRTPEGLWPSDHAGVVATLVVEN